MDAPALELYGTEEVGGRLGRGLRIYRSDDTVYEARTTVDGTVSRLYEENGRWHAAVRFPPTDREEAYDRMQGVMDDINDAYGTALDTNPKQFGDTINRDGRITVGDRATQVRYVEEEDPDDDDHIVANASRAAAVKGWLTGTSATVGGSAGVGALAGGAFGMLAGPPGAVGGAIAGASVGSIGGGVVSFLETCDTIVTRSGDYPSDAPITGRAIRYFDARERAKYHPAAIGAAKEHFEQVNTCRALEVELEQRNRFDQVLHDRLEALRDREIEDIHDTVMEEHFHGFEDHTGLTAVHEADTYADAAAFAGHIMDLLPPTSEPSLYTAPDAFRTVFDHLTYTEQAEEHYLDDAETLVHNVYDNPDTADTIIEWLEDEHADLVQEIGREHALDGR